ncbi:MAG TPA: DUF92 domain-containing protein [Gemmatimonadales bacterium]
MSSAAAFAAWRVRTLTPAGALAAWTVGVLVLRGTGWQGGAVLAAFFISSNLISRGAARPAPVGPDPKTDRRDLWQVYANGGAAALGACVGLVDHALGIWLVTITLAAAAADTWATSIGTRSRDLPRLPWSGRTVPAGSSGGMTLLGTAGGAAGALIVAGTGAIAADMPLLLPIGTLVGFLGMVADSTLGALFQGRFHCPACDAASEWRVHRCGAATTREGGMAWLNNDGVNFVATVLAGAAAVALWHWLSPG